MKRLLPSLATAAAFLAALCVPAPAHAAETAAPPSHLAAYNLAWLNYLDPADVPATRYATCLVDSGVRVTPDTPATSPEGPIIARLAVDGGSGEPEGETDAHLHGTRMAMAMAAPQNDWGTIGTWTGARVVSVRGTTAGESSFRAEFYEKAITACTKFQTNSGTPISAVSLSLGCGGCALTEEEQAVLEDRIVRAHGFGMSVVAAAGNDAGEVQLPASMEGVFSVAAGDSVGGLCSYGSFGAEVSVLGPACPIDGADPVSGVPGSYLGGGSSVATAVTASFVSALRALRPDATWDQVESWIRDSARLVDGRRVLDGKAAADAAGLGAVVARAEARQSAAAAPSPVPPAPTASSEPSATSLPGGELQNNATRARRLPRPRIAAARWKRGQLRIRAASRPARAQLSITAERLKSDGLGVRSRRRVIGSTSRVVASTQWRPGRVRLCWLPAASRDDRKRSPQLVLYRHGSRYR